MTAYMPLDDYWIESFLILTRYLCAAFRLLRVTVFLSPVRCDSLSGFTEPGDILSKALDVDGCEVFWCVRDGFAERRQELRRNQGGNVMFLETQEHTRLCRVQPCREPVTVEYGEGVSRTFISCGEHSDGGARIESRND